MVAIQFISKALKEKSRPTCYSTEMNRYKLVAVID